MQLFDPENNAKNERNKKIYTVCELVYTLVDFCAAAMFVIGSILFFNDDSAVTATWCFLIGSIFFGLKPSIRLIRELSYLRAGEYERMP